LNNQVLIANARQLIEKVMFANGDMALDLAAKAVLRFVVDGHLQSLLNDRNNAAPVYQYRMRNPYNGQATEWVTIRPDQVDYILKNTIAANVEFQIVPSQSHLESFETEQIIGQSNEVAELRSEIAILKAKLAVPVVLPKTNGYWNDEEKAFEKGINLARRAVNKAGFRVEGDEE